MNTLTRKQRRLIAKGLNPFTGYKTTVYPPLKVRRKRIKAMTVGRGT